MLSSEYGTYDVNRAPLYLASLYLRLKAMGLKAGFGCLLLPASVPCTEIPHNKMYKEGSPMFN